jgi:hypothetical protein
MSHIHSDSKIYHFPSFFSFMVLIMSIICFNEKKMCALNRRSGYSISRLGVMKTHCKFVSSHGVDCEDCYILEFYSVKSDKSTDVSDELATSIMIMRCGVFSSMYCQKVLIL